MKILAMPIMVIAIISAALMFLAPIREKAGNMLLNAIVRELDKEEAERLERIENHMVVIGRDTVKVWGDHYNIGKATNPYTIEQEGNLWIVIEDAEDVIFGGVTQFDDEDGKFYVISREGYAIVDSNDYCRVYITVPKEEFEMGYGTDKNGNKVYYHDYVESKYVKYLDSYDEFSKEEREFFAEQKKKEVITY